MEDLIDTIMLDRALDWCRQQRRDWPVHDDIWTVSLNWDVEKPRIINELLEGKYCFEPVRVIKAESGKVSWIWHARDAIVLKAIAEALKAHIGHTLLDTCTHIKGHGGLHGAIQATTTYCKTYEFVFKSDVKHFYETINHDLLLLQLSALNSCPLFLNFMTQFLEHTEQYGGLYSTLTLGISKSCPLSPLLGAIYLTPLDKAMAQLPVKYIRFMDDWVIFAKTRWQLRRAIKLTNQVLDALRLTKHPDKTFIGRVSKTFDFCGFSFSPDGAIALAKKTAEKFTLTLHKLYEYSQEAEAKVKQYKENFRRWLEGINRRLNIVGGVVVAIPNIDDGTVTKQRVCGQIVHCATLK